MSNQPFSAIRPVAVSREFLADIANLQRQMGKELREKRRRAANDRKHSRMARHARWNSAGLTPDDVEKALLIENRKLFVENRDRVPVGEITVGSSPGSPGCRFREVTIKECLKDVCVEMIEDVPISSSYIAEMTAPVQFEMTEGGPFPKFRISIQALGEQTTFEWLTFWQVGAFEVVKPLVLHRLGFRTSVATGNYSVNGLGGLALLGVSITPFAFSVVSGVSQWLGSWGWTQDLLVRSEDQFLSGSYLPLNGGIRTPLEPTGDLAVAFEPGEKIHFALHFRIEWMAQDAWTFVSFLLDDYQLVPYLEYRACHQVWEMVEDFDRILPGVRG